MTRRLERIAYCSRSLVSMDSLVMIADILAVSQRNNRRDHITGALVYSDGAFFQVVEGAPDDLDRLLRRLADDPRHSDIKVVVRSAVSGRLFADWSMTAPRITPGRASEMKIAVEACETSPTTAIEALRRLAAEDAVHPADQGQDS
jgi:hypothetical protein